MKISNRPFRALGIFAAPLFLVFASALLAQESYNEPWRPQFHFTPAKNFMNDPNGLVYYEGEYHLFYQYNPQGTEWGHMSWGHAVSTDMLHWKNLSVAIPEEPGKYMVYSGSAVVDWHNVSGLCASTDSRNPSCLIAIYTAAGANLQKQHLAYSNDRGRTWANFAGNPIADLKQPDFRDPKVFWYEAQQKWVMVAVLADERRAVFFDSKDLKNWVFRSSFEIAGNDKGQWECPDLFELPVNGDPKNKKWVLIVNRNPALRQAALERGILSALSMERTLSTKLQPGKNFGPTMEKISTRPIHSPISLLRTGEEFGLVGSVIGSTRAASLLRPGAEHSRCLAS